MSRRALVLGGSGTVGAAVVRALKRAGVRVTFTYFRGQARAQALAAASEAEAVPLDLRDPDAVVALLARGEPFDVLVHAAGVLPTEHTVAALDHGYQVMCRSAYVAAQALAARLEGEGDIVLVGALDRGQSLPIPGAFAACQGMLPAMAMALAKELGPRGVRVNVAALGLLDAGLSLGLEEAVRERYLAYSALRRLGRADEAAAAIAWLALENRYMSGKVLPVNGGL